MGSQEQEMLQNYEIILPDETRQLLQRDLVTAPLHPLRVGACFHDHDVDAIQPMRTEAPSLFCCTQGLAWFSCGDKIYSVRQGEYLILPPDTQFACGAQRGICLWRWVAFEGRTLTGFLSNKVSVRALPPDFDEKKFTNVLFRIQHTLESGHSVNNLRFASTHLVGMLSVLCFKYYTVASEPTGVRLKDNEMVEHAVRFMQKNLHRHLTLDEIAAHVRFSPTYFSTLFKRLTKHGPIFYFNMMKMQRACELLETTDERINCICHKLGISDNYYFSRLFSKYMNMTPTDFRRACRQQAGAE